MTPFMKQELRAAMETVATMPGCPRKVYNAIADELHWTRPVSDHEMSTRWLAEELLYRLIPIVEKLDECANDPGGALDSSIRRIKQRLEILSKPEAS